MLRLLIAALVIGALPACIEGEQFEDPPCPETSVTDDYAIDMKVSSTDVHVGEVATYTFTVQRQGAPVAGLAPTVSWEQLATGATGTIKLTAGAPGAYAGSRAFFSGGAYSLVFAFKEGSSTVSRTFPLSVQSH